MAGVAGLEACQLFIGFPSKHNYSNELNDFLKTITGIEMNQVERKHHCAG
jgi:hypothetical protein